MSGQLPIERTCIGCGYPRAGLERGARCPECGMEGFDEHHVVQGVPTAASPAIRGAVIGNAFIAVVVVIWFAQKLMALTTIRWTDLGFLCVCTAIPFAAIGLLVVSIVRGRRVVEGLDGPTSVSSSMWVVHPRGIAVCTGARRAWFPVEEIERIECVDSIFGQLSTIRIVRKGASVRRMFDARPELFLRGPKDTRRAEWRAIRTILGLA